MISKFHCRESDQRLTILNYDEKKTNGRYRAVINQEKVAVLHLHTVDAEEAHHDVAQHSLCPGVLESEVLSLLSQSPVSNSLACSLFLIEKMEERFMYR